MDVRPVLVPLLALTIALLVPASPGGQEADETASEPPSAVDLIKSRCLSCHGPTTMLAFSRRILDAGGPAALDTLLARHHAPDAEARAAIVQYLSQSLGGTQ